MMVFSMNVIMVDKVEHNLLTVNHHHMWGALYNFEMHILSVLDMKTIEYLSIPVRMASMEKMQILHSLARPTVCR